MSQFNTRLLPWCGNGGDTDEIPLALTLDEIMRWTWRIREWSVGISGNVVAHTDTYPDNVTPFSATGVASWDFLIPNSEKGLICVGSLGSQVLGSAVDVAVPVDWTDSIGNPQTSIMDVGGFVSLFLNDGFRLVGDDYKPNCLCRIGFSGSTSIPVAGNFGNEYTFASCGNWTINAQPPITLKAGQPAPSIPFAGEITLDNISVTMTPSLFWAYAPTSGGLPIYDTLTGTEINPNVVID